MRFGELGEEDEDGSPDDNEETDYEQGDSPSRCVLSGPKIAPVSSVRSREPVVLDDDGDEEPENDLTADNGVVEGWHFTRYLAVVFRKTQEENDADNPHEDTNGEGD